MAKKSSRIPARSWILITLAGLLATTMTLAVHSPFRIQKQSTGLKDKSFFPVILHYLPSSTPIPSPTRPARLLLISEVQYDPYGEEPEGEWIEIYNGGSDTILLTDYKLGDAWRARDAEGMLSFPPRTEIAPGQVMVIANQADVFYAAYQFKPDFEMKDSDSQVADMARYPSWAERNVELTNGGDEVLLLGKNNEMIDGLSWGISREAFSPPISRVGQGHSLERYPPYQDTDSAVDWRDCAAPDPGAVDLTPPTPTPTLSPTITLTRTPTLPPTPTSTPTITITPTREPFPILTRTPTLTRTQTSTALIPTDTAVPRMLLISELVYDPAGTEPDGEWIEIYNPDTVSVILSDYKVGDEETRGGNEGMLQFPGGSILTPGQVVVIANRAVAFSALYGFQPDFEMVESNEFVPNMVRYQLWASGSVNLANDYPHDEVLLLGPGDVFIDGISWGVSNWAFDPPAPDIPEAYSLERVPANLDSDTATDWISQNSPDPGNVDLAFQTQTPTPSQTSSPSPTGSPSPSVTPTPTELQASGLVINEIFADPSAQFGDANGDGRIDAWEDEFIELVNNTGGNLDLSGWSIANSSGLRHVFPNGSQVQNRCAAIVFGGGTPTGHFGGSLVQTASLGWLTLRNYGDILYIYNQQGGLVATYTYGAEGGEDQSLARFPDITGPEPLIKHSLIEGSAGALFSPGTRIDGGTFDGCPSNIVTEGKTHREHAQSAPSLFYSLMSKLSGRLLAIHLADDHHHLALDFNRAGILDVDGLHRGISWLEAYVPVLQVKVLESRFVPIAQPDSHQFAIMGFARRFHYDNVPIVDHRIDHRVSLDFEGEQVIALFSGW